jgi:hypothetical protein
MTNFKHDLVRPTRTWSAAASWPLAPIDRYAFRWVIQGTWVFDARLDANALKHGLGRLLESYPLLCGRVVAGNRIEWSEKGVPVVEETDETLGAADFDASRVDAARFAHRLRPELIRVGLAPLIPSS